MDGISLTGCGDGKLMFGETNQVSITGKFVEQPFHGEFDVFRN
jgi:hypothetical protein